MKKYIHAKQTLSPEKILESQFGSLNPGYGCSFVAPDGTFVNIYPTLDVHEDACEWIEDELGIELSYQDEEYFVREYGWIRLRTDPRLAIVELPSNRPTNDQWYALQDWLEFVEDRGEVPMYLNVCDGNDGDVEYSFGTEYFAEDIFKILKRYYTSGKLYAKTIVKKR